MLQDLDSLTARLRQLLAHVRDLQAQRAQHQTMITDLQRERDALRETLAQREVECADSRATLVRHAQQHAQQQQEYAAELAQMRLQTGRAHEQLQQELFQCQGERDQAITQLQSSLTQSQRLRGAAQQAHGLVDTLLMRLPDTAEG